MRKKRAKKRYLTPDSKFNSQLATRFVNNIMLDGKKNVAFKIFYEALDGVSQKIDDSESIKVWEKALENVMPHVEVRSRRIGGATFQIPHPIREDRRISLAMKWMINAALSQLIKKRELHLRKNKILTRWLKPTKHFHILDFN